DPYRQADPGGTLRAGRPVGRRARQHSSPPERATRVSMRAMCGGAAATRATARGRAARARRRPRRSQHLRSLGRRPRNLAPHERAPSALPLRTLRGRARLPHLRPVNAGMAGVRFSGIEHAPHEFEEVDAELKHTTVAVPPRVEGAAARVEGTELEPLDATRRRDDDRPRRWIEAD